MRTEPILWSAISRSGRIRRDQAAEVAVEPWCPRETGLDLDVLAQSESVFVLSNGHIGWRGTLDEGEPHGSPGSYPEGWQTVTNGKQIRLGVGDQPVDVRHGQLIAHERVLKFRTGLLRRQVEYVSRSRCAGHLR